MTRRKSKKPRPGDQQQYDNAIKSLFEEREAEILPHFLPESVYLETLTIEVMRTPLRVDRVYKVLYQEHEHILHIEFETGSDPTMASRLLDYHTYFYHKYQLPVTSLIVYPFRTAIAVSPLEEITHQGKLILTFHFLVLPFWKEKAQKYLQKHAVEMYAFLPAMEGANLALLSEAISEMVKCHWDDQPKLARELRWMGIILRRADIVPLEEKQMIERRLSMYDDLMEKDPKMQQLFAEREAKAEAIGEAKGKAIGEAKGKAIGEAKGKAIGEVKIARRLIVEMVQMRFPALSKLAQQRVNQLSTIKDLHALFRQMNMVHDESEVRALLESPFT